MAGGSQPHNNAQPYLAVSFIIALSGVFPARN
jgi:microcystin-dependent protein